MSAALRTVLGDVPAHQMGITLPHEHLRTDSSVWFQPSEHEYSHCEPALHNLWWMRQYPNSNPSVLRLTDEDLVVEELEPFRDLGGRTVIELTTVGLGRDVSALASMASRTGLQIVAGTGHYVQAAHAPGVAQASIDELAADMVDEITNGVADTGIRCGVIGEIGISYPIHPDEAKVLSAAALAQRQTGAAIAVHTAAHRPDVDSALDVADILESAGADLSRVVMAHLDTSLHRPDYHRRVAERGCIVEYDLFGHEFFESENAFQSFGDTERVHAVAALIADGYGTQLLLSHDICYLIQLRSYGGYGYAHLLQNISARLALMGIDNAALLSLMVDNPARIFPLATSEASES
ncbi:phosphotriesterase family protein [Mycobacterium antarcticum]|uniref:phosphotriesterase family protein n=1 Tax=Mycolicibacterium sp. TUM20984 TaxID=3023368 RepID=UPI0023A011D7|nr:hypothetical protein [Mycolicibacterium sp. TUM20984]GLP83016.1 aryldialkylphosphatase [Mycolicibacterium sp. TUM20984]